MLNDYLGRTVGCECGREHIVPVQNIESDLSLTEISQRCESALGGKKAALICDAATDEAINNRLIAQLEAAGWQLSLKRYSVEGALVNDEAVLGAAVFNVPLDADGIIAVGGGTITDLGRFVGSRMGKPFCLVMTCPSMDGYASNVAGMMLGGRKKIFKDCRFPNAVLGNAEVMANAPYSLVKSGFGDMLGKRTALPDWILARHVKGEPFCKRTYDIMDKASLSCIDALPGIIERDVNAIDTLSQALCLAGVCMAMANDTRPASGSEHIFSHYMVEGAINAGREVPSHGETVGFGTLVSTLLYDYLLKVAAPDELRPIAAELESALPQAQAVRKMLDESKIGSAVGVHLAGYDQLRDMIMTCAAPGKRYTVLRYLSDNGLLEKAADYVLDNVK